MINLKTSVGNCKPCTTFLMWICGMQVLAVHVVRKFDSVQDDAQNLIFNNIVTTVTFQINRQIIVKFFCFSFLL